VCTDSSHLKHKSFLRIIRMQVRSGRKNQDMEKKSLIHHRSKVFNTAVCCGRTERNVPLVPSLLGFLLNPRGSEYLSQTFTSCLPCTSLFHLLVTFLALCISPLNSLLAPGGLCCSKQTMQLFSDYVHLNPVDFAVLCAKILPVLLV